MVLGLILEFSKLSLATAIMVLTPVSYYYLTSFNYGDKEAKDVGLTCRYHLSIIIPDSIFYDSHCLPEHKRDRFSCIIIITPMALGNL